jgi:DNA-binding transcriptional MocR family regulator
MKGRVLVRGTLLCFTWYVEHTLRLNSVSQPPETIEEGIQRLGKAAKRLATNQA